MSYDKLAHLSENKSHAGHSAPLQSAKGDGQLFHADAI